MADTTPAPIGPLVYVRNLRFSDGTSMDLSGPEFVIFVGPNNAGKSAALRNIAAMALNTAAGGPVVTDLKLGRNGNAADAFKYAQRFGRAGEADSISVQHHQMGFSVTLAQCEDFTSGGRRGNHNHIRLHFQDLGIENRLKLADAVAGFSTLNSVPTAPAQRLFLDEELELKISRHFRTAFGRDFVINRGGGSQIDVLCGNRPERGAEEEYFHQSFLEKLAELEPVSNQGDGMRCFAGILLSVLTEQASVVIIDEPEAFLHPPQAVQLGRLLAQERTGSMQLFAATHSSDFLRGVLNAAPKKVTVVRLQRDGAVNRVRLMDHDQIRQMWQDPLLRHSNLLDGLFHERVIVCEGDADCRFYSAIFDAAREADPDAHSPDCLFAPVFGKSRSLMAVRALRAIGLPTSVALDFDALSDSLLIKSLYLELGGDWTRIETKFTTVVNAINQRIVKADSLEVRKELLRREIEGIETAEIPQARIRRIRELLEPPSPWKEAKRLGAAYLPAGDVLSCWTELSKNLAAAGIFIASVGELESWDRTLNGSLHGPAWVQKALEKNLATAPELEAARQFVWQLTQSAPAVSS